MLTYALGFIGALAPEVIRLYKRRHKPLGDQFPPSYFIISVLYAALGGLVAVLLAEDSNEISALYTGAALPLLIDAGARAIVDKDGEKGDGSGIEELEIEKPTLRDNLSKFVHSL